MRRAASIALSAALALQGQALPAQPADPKRPDAERAAFLESTRLARRALYPAYDEATLLTGEAFVSRSLGREAPDMLLQDFNLAAVPGTARFVAAALLKPAGFAPPYTLLEVAVLQPLRGAAGMRVLHNLKVRVDDGTGAGQVQMQLGSVEGRTPALAGFEVTVTADGQAVRHRFSQGPRGLVLVESLVQ